MAISGVGQSYYQNNVTTMKSTKNVKDQKLDATFSDIKTENKAAFLESLKVFQNNNPNFLSSIINRELASKFWSI